MLTWKLPTTTTSNDYGVGASRVNQIKSTKTDTRLIRVNYQFSYISYTNNYASGLIRSRSTRHHHLISLHYHSTSILKTDVIIRFL